MTLAQKIFNPGVHSINVNVLLLVVRVAVGIFMLTHGMGKLERLLGDEVIQFSDPLGVGATASLALAVFSEFLCSILLIIGFGSRLFAVPLLITMLVAAFMVHMPDGFGKQELPLLYAVIYLVIIMMGSGRYSLDHLIFKKNKV